MSYITRHLVRDRLPSTDADGNVLWMIARNILPNLKAYEEFAVYVSPAETDELMKWYTECNKHFGLGWPQRLDQAICSGLNLQAARKKIDAERGC